MMEQDERSVDQVIMSFVDHECIKTNHKNPSVNHCTAQNFVQMHPEDVEIF